MPHFYSQHGEDVVLNELFKDKKTGFFVEVGCIDGRRFSNTLTFEERGWKGLCVEAHAGYIELLKKNRPGSIVCRCAVGEKDEEDVSFYGNSRGSLSTLDNSQETRFKEQYGKYFTGFEEQRVSKRTLNTLFRDHGVTGIDILSLDIEGYEIEAIKGLDLKKYKPKVLVIETDSTEQEKQIDALLLPHGYNKFLNMGENIFYLIDKKMGVEIQERNFKVELIHSAHPLDNEADVRVKAKVTIGSETISGRVLSAFKKLLPMRYR